jgi:hypothetical protein
MYISPLLKRSQVGIGRVHFVNTRDLIHARHLSFPWLGFEPATLLFLHLIPLTLPPSHSGSPVTNVMKLFTAVSYDFS